MVLPTPTGPESVARAVEDRADVTAPATTVFGPTGVDPGGLAPLTAHQLDVSTSVTGTVTTVRVHGELLQETVTRFADVVAAFADDVAIEELVVDLTAASFMDSTGLGALVSLRNQVLAREGRFAVVRPDDRVFRLFELTRLDTVFEFVAPG